MGILLFYSSHLYRETGNIMYALGGSINRHSGEIAFTGTAHPVENTSPSTKHGLNIDYAPACTLKT